MSKRVLIALCGKSASGKDTIAKAIVSDLPDITHFVVSATTRPRRENEVDGVDYHFLTDMEMLKKILNFEIIEASTHKWVYGTLDSEIKSDKINIAVLNIDGIDILMENKDIEVIPVMIEASDKKRLLRSLTREINPDCNEIIRRFSSDNEDFENLPFEPKMVFSNENKADFNHVLEELSKLILKKYGKK